MYILESARKYSLKANHRDIGEQSTGLALYFNTIVHFAALMAVLFAVSGVYPLHEYYTKVNLDTEYQVVVYSRTMCRLRRRCVTKPAPRVRLPTPSSPCHSARGATIRSPRPTTAVRRRAW